MRVLVVQETDWIDRNPVLHHRMLEDLSRRGDEIVVVDFDILWHTKGRRPLLQRRQVITGVTKFFPDAEVKIVRPATLRLPAVARPSWLVANVPELRRMFREFRPEVVVAYSITNAYVALRLARRHGVPFVYHVMDALHTLAEPTWLHPVAKPVERLVMGEADEVVVINNALAHYAVSMGARPDRVRVVPIGTHVAPEPDSASIEQTRTSLGIAPSDTVMMFMGWLYTFSGLAEVVHSLAEHREQAPGLKFLVVGDGDMAPELQRLRTELELEDRVILTGKRPSSEIPALLAAADVCLLPARRVSTMEHIVPSKLVEYLAAGRPVVATKLPGIHAEFGDDPGLLYIDEPAEAVPTVVKAIMGDDDPRARAAELGRSSRRLMEQRPGWDEVTARFESIVHGARVRA